MKNITLTAIDFTYLHSVSGGDKTFEKMVLLGAVDDIQSQIEQLEKAWHNKEAENIRRIAHSLKSVVAIAGLEELETNCNKLDHLFSDDEFHPEGFSFLKTITYGWVTTRPLLQEMIAKTYK